MNAREIIARIPAANTAEELDDLFYAAAQLRDDPATERVFAAIHAHPLMDAMIELWDRQLSAYEAKLA